MDDNISTEIYFVEGPVLVAGSESGSSGCYARLGTHIV